MITTFWILFFYFLSIFTVTRYVMVKHFISNEILTNPEYNNHFKRMYYLGFRFDLKIIAIILSIPFIFGIPLSFTDFITTKTNAYFWTSYISIFGFLAITITITNYFYFKTYQNYYDIFMFGIVEDDTKAVLKNIYDDYPIITGTIGVVCLTLIASYFTYQALYYQWFIISNVFINIGLFLTSILFIAGFARGSINSTPLGKKHAQVSSLSIINKMVPNGIIAMEWAFSDRRKNIHFTPVTIEEGLSLLHTATHKHTFIEKTPHNEFLVNHPPHIVFALMESFGTNCLIFDNPETNDLLGKLRPYFDSDFVFKRFLSAFNGTAPSLASLYFHSPIQNISQSIAQQTSLPYTPFLTYKAKGYKTIFITSGNIMWRNLGNYLPLQGVDEVFDQNTIIDIFPESKKTLSYWGLADEYAFALAEKLLKESTQPLFINILTITNHPPYQVPHHYDVKNIDISHLKGKFSENVEECKKVLSTFQYAANALGSFIENIEKSELADKTIISATGDHHIRGMRLTAPTELFLDKAVPFFIHIPKPLQAHLSLQYDPNRIGSHKDIMPTLYAISLSDAEYWNIGGINLLSTSNNDLADFAINETIWADSEGVIDLHSTNYQKYAWEKDAHLLVEHPIPTPEIQISKIKAYQALSYWQINYLVTHSKN